MQNNNEVKNEIKLRTSCHAYLIGKELIKGFGLDYKTNLETMIQSIILRIQQKFKWNPGRAFDLDLNNKMECRVKNEEPTILLHVIGLQIEVLTLAVNIFVFDEQTKMCYFIRKTNHFV